MKQLVLRVDRIIEGIQKTCSNAYDLAQAAFIIDDQFLKAKARALYILAIEEYGKVGWLYWALSVQSGDVQSWRYFWDGFVSHSTKNEIGRLMARHLTTKGLLPLRSEYFRFRLEDLGSIRFLVSPRALDQVKQGMLYTDFDEASGHFVSPTDRVSSTKLDNSEYFDELSKLIRYIEYNRQHHVFDPRVMKAFHELNQQAKGNRPILATLMRLLYACVLHHPTVMSEESISEIIQELRSKYEIDPDSLVKEMTELGKELQQKS